MIARKYSKLIEVWKTTNVPDGFGGNTVSDEQDFTAWANVTTKNANIIDNAGQIDNVVKTVFIIRNRATLDLSVKDSFIKYNGLTYNIESIEDKDLDNIDVKITANRRG